MARVLSVEEYGLWGLALALQVGLATFGIVGIVEAVVGLLPRYRSPAERVYLFSAANKTFFLTVSVSLLAGALLGLLIARRSEIGAVALSGALASGALLAFSMMRAQIVRLEEKHPASLAFSFVVPLSGLIGSVIAFALNPSIESFFVGSTLGLALAIMMLRGLRIGIYGVLPSDSNASAEILGRLLPYIAVAFFGWLSGYGNNLAIDLLFQSAEVARFTFAFTLGAVMQLVASALNQVWSPRFYRITHAHSFTIVERKNRLFYGAQAVVLGTVAAICLVLFPPALRAVGGNLAFYGSMTWEFFFVMTAYVCLVPWWHCHSYLLAYDQGHRIMRIVLVTSIIGLTIWFTLMWALGPFGIYAGFLVQMAVRSIGIIYFTRQTWPVQIPWLGVSGGVLIALTGTLISIYLMPTFEW